MEKFKVTSKNSLRGKLIKTIAKEFLYKQVIYTSTDVLEINDNLKRELNKHLSFETNINNIELNNATRSYSGNILFPNENGTASVCKFVVQPKAII